jgi:hypothetical protein
MFSRAESTRGVKWLLVALSIGTLWGIGATVLLIRELNENTPLPQTADPLAIDDISIPSQCPRNARVSEGPTWRDITIGVSNALPVSELYGIHVTLQGPPLWANEGFADSYGIFLIRERAEALGLPMSVQFCLVDNKILALTMGLPEDGSFPIGDITEWITEYGIPEIITWKEGTSDWCNRILAWPESGIAVEFNVTAIEAAPHLMRTNIITLLPYAVGEDYRRQWPYNDFLDNTPPSGNNLDGCPTEKNPFDFVGMRATSTPSN